MILVTGATGTIGSNVLDRLARLGKQVRAMSRDPSRVRTASGVEIVPGDFEQPASLERAVSGVRTLFLLTAPGPSVAAHDLAMLEAARSAGVTKVVKLSAIGTGDDEGPESAGSWHFPGEQAVKAGDLAWTVLRPTSFASNALRWVGAIATGNPIPNLQGTGTQGVVDPRDVAAVAVEALVSSKHEGQTYTLTGPELISLPDQAARLEQVLGHPVTTVDVPLDVAREQMLASGMDPAFVTVVINGAKIVRAGGNAIVTEDVYRVLGRPPTGFDTWVRDHRDAFTTSTGDQV